MPRPSSSRLSLWFWRRFLAPERGRFALIALLTIVGSAITGLYPVVIERAFTALEARDPRAAWLLPLLIVAMTAARAATGYAQGVSTQRLTLGVARRIQTTLFGHLIAADYARLAREPSGQLTSRFTHDTSLVRESLSRLAAGAVDALTVVTLLVSMLWLDWALALVVLGTYPLAVVPIVRLGRRLRKVASAAAGEVGELTSTLQETFTGVRMVKAYRLEAYAAARAAALFDRLFNRLMSSARARAAVDPMLEILGGVAIAAVLGFAAWRIQGGASSIGAFTGLISALLMAARPVRALGTLHLALQDGLAAADRLRAVLDEPAQVVDAPGAQPLPPGGGAVRFEAVGFAYPGAAATAGLTVEGIELEVPAGATVALVGPSGAGKSTLINLVPRLYDATAGRVLVDGADVRQVQLASLRDRIALVSQDVILFDASVAENVALGRPGAGAGPLDAATRAEIQAALADAAAWGFVQSLPQGMDARVGERGGRLSGGERQRIALARALYRRPSLLLLDEATSALDAANEAQVQQALDRLIGQVTTLVIAHRLATVQRADRIYVLEAGRIVEQGTHAQLLAGDGLYARLCRMQAFSA